MKRAPYDLLSAVVIAFVVVMLSVFLLDSRRHRGYAIVVRQTAQVRCMDAAIELFNNEVNMHPPSDANDPTGKPYCGAMKFAEAMIGQDLLGFHSRSVFRRDGLDPNTLTLLYPASPPQDNLRARRGPYLPIESAVPCRLADVYGKGNTGPFPEDVYVLCDTCIHKRPSGKKTGMPILYYRANSSGTTHEAGGPFNTYDDADNRALIALGVPGEPGKIHPLLDPKRFYLNTQNDRSPTPEPARRDFILISAGRDGVYGTPDDIYNFEWKYHK